MSFFRNFITETNGVIDASGVISKECYDAWLCVQNFERSSAKTAKLFYRHVTNHVSGIDKRRPFDPDEEAALLKLLRRGKRWPCMENSSQRFGCKPFVGRGFHEKKNKVQRQTFAGILKMIDKFVENSIFEDALLFEGLELIRMISYANFPGAMRAEKREVRLCCEFVSSVHMNLKPVVVFDILARNSCDMENNAKFTGFSFLRTKTDLRVFLQGVMRCIQEKEYRFCLVDNKKIEYLLVLDEKSWLIFVVLDVYDFSLYYV